MFKWLKILIYGKERTLIDTLLMKIEDNRIKRMYPLLKKEIDIRKSPLEYDKDQKSNMERYKKRQEEIEILHKQYMKISEENDDLMDQVDRLMRILRIGIK